MSKPPKPKAEISCDDLTRHYQTEFKHPQKPHWPAGPIFYSFQSDLPSNLFQRIANVAWATSLSTNERHLVEAALRLIADGCNLTFEEKTSIPFSGRGITFLSTDNDHVRIKDSSTIAAGTATTHAHKSHIYRAFITLSSLQATIDSGKERARALETMMQKTTIMKNIAKHQQGNHASNKKLDSLLTKLTNYHAINYTSNYLRNAQHEILHAIGFEGHFPRILGNTPVHPHCTIMHDSPDYQHPQLIMGPTDKALCQSLIHTNDDYRYPQLALGSTDNTLCKSPYQGDHSAMLENDFLKLDLAMAFCSSIILGVLRGASHQTISKITNGFDIKLSPSNQIRLKEYLFLLATHYAGIPIPVVSHIMYTEVAAVSAQCLTNNKPHVSTTLNYALQLMTGLYLAIKIYNTTDNYGYDFSPLSQFGLTCFGLSVGHQCIEVATKITALTARAGLRLTQSVYHYACSFFTTTPQTEDQPAGHDTQYT